MLGFDRLRYLYRSVRFSVCLNFYNILEKTLILGFWGGEGEDLLLSCLMWCVYVCGVFFLKHPVYSLHVII